MLHQRALATEVTVVEPGGYAGGGFGRGAATASCTRPSRGSAPTARQLAQSPMITGAVLAVDVALSPDGEQLAVVAAGNPRVSPDSPPSPVPVTDPSRTSVAPRRIRRRARDC